MGAQGGRIPAAPITVRQSLGFFLNLAGPSISNPSAHLFF
jgi:hypothetical protein